MNRPAVEAAALRLRQVLLLLHDLPRACRYHWPIHHIARCAAVLQILVHLHLPRLVIIGEGHVQDGILLGSILRCRGMNLTWLERSVPQSLTVSIVREVVRKHAALFYPLCCGYLWFQPRLQRVAVIWLLEVVMARSRAWLLMQQLGTANVREIRIVADLLLELFDLHLMDILLDLLC